MKLMREAKSLELNEHVVIECSLACRRVAHGTVSGSPKVLERRHRIMRNPEALLVEPAKLVGSVGDSVIGRSPEEVCSLPQLGLARLT